jgi:hypothetical protein
VEAISIQNRQPLRWPWWHNKAGSSAVQTSVPPRMNPR